MAKQKLTKWYYNNLKVNNWNLYVAVSEQGVTFIGSNNKGFNELESWLKKKGPNILLIADQEGKTNLAMEQLTEYLMGKRTFFTLAFDFTGTLFQKKVWAEVAKITIWNNNLLCWYCTKNWTSASNASCGDSNWQ
ncbi:MAG: hypothetical protein SPLM_07270 [Spiroplasma phoeniceum]